MRAVKLFYILAFLSVFSVGAPQKRFPEWRGSRVLLPGLWQATPIVAVGDVKNVTAFGQQTVEHLPYPVTQDLHKLYWCQGDFELVANIKGTFDTKKKYVWASVNPGCKLFYGDPRDYLKRVTKVWFLREEGEFLRPTFDGGTYAFYGLYTKWNDGSALEPDKKCGALLLTPSANADTLAGFAKSIWDAAEVACSVLGETV